MEQLRRLGPVRGQGCGEAGHRRGWTRRTDAWAGTSRWHSREEAVGAPLCPLAPLPPCGCSQRLRGKREQADRLGMLTAGQRDQRKDGPGKTSESLGTAGNYTV